MNKSKSYSVFKILLFTCVILFFRNNAFAQSHYNSDTLTSLLSTRENCSNKFRMGLSYASDTSELSPRIIPIDFIGEPDLLKFCMSNKNTVIPILISLLEDERYDWSSALLLYHITRTHAKHMIKYLPDNCSEWRDERKEKEIVYWKSYLVKNY